MAALTNLEYLNLYKTKITDKTLEQLSGLKNLRRLYVWQTAVTDAGVGIAPADRQRILRPFFSSKGEGNGLGLSITQRILEEHDGSLSFVSELGKGTTFTVTLPLAESAPGPLAESAPGPPAEAGPHD